MAMLKVFIEIFLFFFFLSSFFSIFFLCNLNIFLRVIKMYLWRGIINFLYLTEYEFLLWDIMYLITLMNNWNPGLRSYKSKRRKCKNYWNFLLERALLSKLNMWYIMERFLVKSITVAYIQMFLVKNYNSL